MPRAARGNLGPGLFHVTARGNARITIFRDDQDRRAFLGVLNTVIDRYDWRLFAYCLMPNHFHLVVGTNGPGLSTGMRQLSGRYAQHFNKRYDRSGHLFQGRFGVRVVEDERHAEELCRYVLENPLRAGLCEKVDDYRWSAWLLDLEGQPPGRKPGQSPAGTDPALSA